MISEKEMERRRKISESKRGKPRQDVAARNRTPEMRNLPRVISDEGRAKLSQLKTVHGHGRNRSEGRQGTRTYYTWGAMVQRCTNPNSQDWPDYGGRGITVCERWLDFRNFLADMGEKPAGRSLDRIRVDEGYEPGNCRWATTQEQARNKRNTVTLTYDGRTQCLADWAEETGITLTALRLRVKRQWSAAEALTTPVRGRR